MLRAVALGWGRGKERVESRGRSLLLRITVEDRIFLWATFGTGWPDGEVERSERRRTGRSLD